MTIASIAPPPTAAPDPAQHKRLVDAAQQFEAMFLQQMLKPTKDEGETADDGASSSEDSSYGGFASEYASRAIAAAGGLGVASSVVAGVERTAARSHDMNQNTFATSLKTS